MDLSGQPMAARASGAAQRRKWRRLRAALRHEQQSIAMALASALHHSADKTTTAQHNEKRGQKNTGTEHYELSDEEDKVPARGSQPPCLGEPRGPQARDQLRTMEQTADYAPLVQILDPLVQSWEEELPNVRRFFLTRWPVGAEQVWNCEARQVVGVPKISPDRTWQRLGDSLRQLQTADQLVDVPTIVSCSSLFGNVEQNADIPVPPGRVGVRGFQGFRPGQDSAAFGRADHAEIPVPRCGFDEGFHSFPPEQVSTASLEQTVHIPVPHGGQHDLSSSFSSGFFKSAGHGRSRGFSHFSPVQKNAKIPRTQ